MMNINFEARKTNGAMKTAVGQSFVSAKQKEWITSLCTMKRVAMPSFEGMTGTAASELIQKLQALPNWREASQAQINRIIDRCKEMKLEIPDMSGLSMSKASKWIEFLNAKWQAEFAHKVTQKQIDMIRKMCVCADIDNTELFAIPEEVWTRLNDAEMDMKIHMSSDDDIFNEKKAIVESIKEEIKNYASNFELESISKEVASEFIGKNQATYYKWVSTRLSDGQKELINTLLVRMNNEPLEDHVLMQFSGDQADEYINQLQKEMGDTSLHHFGDQAQMMMEVPEAWGGTFTTDTRKETGVLYKQKDWAKCLASLYSLVGQQAEVEMIEATEQDKALYDIIDMLQDNGIEDGLIIGCLQSIMKPDEAVEFLEGINADKAANEVQTNEVPW